MSKLLLVCVATIATAAALLSCDAAAPSSPAPTDADAELAASGREVDPAWPRLPQDRPFGVPLGVATDGRGRVFVAHTAARPARSAERNEDATVFVLDEATGELREAWGAGVFRTPHGISVDARGHVWVTDSEGDEVVELDERGVPLRSLGAGAGAPR